MKVVDFISAGDRRSLKEGQSDVSKRTGLRSPSGKILPPQEGEIGAGGAEGDPVSLVVGAHPREGVGSCHLPLEMIDTRGFHAGSRRLVVTAVPVQPGNGVRVRAPIGGNVPWPRGTLLGKGSLGKQERRYSGDGEASAGAQELTPIDDAWYTRLLFMR